MDRAEPPLQAEIMIKSSMTLSLILEDQLNPAARPEATHLPLPLWTIKTSWSRTDVSGRGSAGKVLYCVRYDLLISTLVSPLLNLRSSTLSGCLPSLAQMDSTSFGCEDPEKMHVCRMVGSRARVTVVGREEGNSRRFYLGVPGEASEAGAVLTTDPLSGREHSRRLKPMRCL